MEPRIKNPAGLNPEAMQAMQALGASLQKGGVPARTLSLVHMRTSQINGCAVCLALHPTLFKDDETPERIYTVAGWRDAPYFSDTERAALALAEAVTRIADKSDPVPDDVWQEAARHYDERGLATLVLAIAATNTWNRINVATRQVAGSVKLSAEQATAARHA